MNNPQKVSIYQRIAQNCTKDEKFQLDILNDVKLLHFNRSDVFRAYTAILERRRITAIISCSDAKNSAELARSIGFHWSENKITQWLWNQVTDNCFIINKHVITLMETHLTTRYVKQTLIPNVLKQLKVNCSVRCRGGYIMNTDTFKGLLARMIECQPKRLRAKNKFSKVTLIYMLNILEITICIIARFQPIAWKSGLTTTTIDAATDSNSDDDDAAHGFYEYTANMNQYEDDGSDSDMSLTFSEQIIRQSLDRERKRLIEYKNKISTNPSYSLTLMRRVLCIILVENTYAYTYIGKVRGIKLIASLKNKMTTPLFTIEAYKEKSYYQNLVKRLCRSKSLKYSKRLNTITHEDNLTKKKLHPLLRKLKKILK